MKARDIVLSVIIVMLVAVMCYSGYKIFSQMMEYHKNEAEYEGLRKYEDKDGGGEAGEIPFSPHTEEKGKFWYIRFPEVDFDSLKEINPDTVGWIYCPDTNIDYPVVQGKDNSVYLHTMFEGGRNAAGSIFMDAENKSDLSDFNTILYGHHMKNGSMFRDLDHFKEEGFYEKHPYMLFMTPEKNYVIEIFAGFVSKTSDDSWRISFPTVQHRQDWIDMLMKKSAFSGIVVPDTASHIMTLSTCSYEFSNARFVVFGLLTEVE